MDSRIRVPIHILMRFSDKLFSIDDTIKEHNDVIKEHNAVWIGKVGRPLGNGNIETINKQCKEGIPTYLYLVQAVKKGVYKSYKGAVIEMSRTLPRDEIGLVPEYYHKNSIIKTVRLWVKLADIESLEDTALMNLKVASSNSAVPDALVRSMAACFVVLEGRGVRLR